MKLKFDRDFLDFKKGKNYDVTPDGTAKYLIRMRIAKPYVTKDGKAADEADAKEAEQLAAKEKEVAPTAKKAKVAPVAKKEIVPGSDVDDLLGFDN